ncbi:MAG: hypothetical protein MR504_04555 [Methanobrevibacter woesei]|uniref:hypothetical protein n=1 Tax=Methanobrevibacter woesei TaxID=190976 RepID=UPI0023F32B93|nr:hypothetical protein [Methanobrevibacter woesei]MCI7291456.1 hypothetical protein [Methanobrevibacter woesei]
MKTANIIETSLTVILVLAFIYFLANIRLLNGFLEPYFKICILIAGILILVSPHWINNERGYLLKYSQIFIIFAFIITLLVKG